MQPMDIINKERFYRTVCLIIPVMPLIGYITPAMDYIFLRINRIIMPTQSNLVGRYFGRLTKPAIRRSVWRIGGRVADS